MGWAQLVSSSHGSSWAQSAFVIIRQGLQLGLADCGEGHQQQRGWGHVCLLTQQASRGWSRGHGSGYPQSSNAPAGWCFSVSVSAMFAPAHVHKQLSIKITQTRGLPTWLSGKESPASTGDTKDMGSIPGSGSSTEEGNGNPLQYSCLENPIDRGAWQAAVHGITKRWTRWSTHTQKVKLGLSEIEEAKHHNHSFILSF